MITYVDLPASDDEDDRPTRPDLTVPPLTPAQHAACVVPPWRPGMSAGDYYLAIARACAEAGLV